MSCQGILACQFAISDPPRELGPLINKLQSSITAYEKQNPDQIQAYYTDRRYYGKETSRDKYRTQSYEPNRDHTRSYEPNRDQTRPRFPRKPRCFVCNKEGCRSWKHTEEEREESKTKFKTANRGRFSKFDDRFNRRLNQ
jgi:hypothetical protein